MNFPPFWARGSQRGFFLLALVGQQRRRGAIARHEAARQLADRFAHGDFPPKHGGYYPNRPFREPVLQEIKNDAGETAAVITRNSYGCLVLNTARVMFVDVDLPEPKSPGLFSRLFGKPSAAPVVTESSAIAKVENWTRNNSDWGWRIYRTRAGLRLLATHALFDPEAAACDGVFDALGADPLYRQLVQDAEMFPRAADAQAVALRRPRQTGTLAVSGRPRRKTFPEMGFAIPVLLVQLGHVRAGKENWQRRRASRRPAHTEAPRRNDEGGIGIEAGVKRVTF